MLTTGSGCGTLGVNAQHVKADEQKEADFLATNSESLHNPTKPTVNLLTTLPGYKLAIDTR